jgi:uncharacterized protein (TIGR02145 family)
MSKKMKMILVFQIFIIGLFITTINSCKKDDTIIKKDLVITWENPSDILPGTPLSATQLNATAQIIGIFVYTPPIGTVLSLGASQDLKVTFTPYDTTDYNIVSKTVKINVRHGVSSALFNPSLTYGTMTDQDGNVYKTIVIGTQTWMAENLRVATYRNGNPIPNVTDIATWATLATGAFVNLNNTKDIDQIATYGRMYNWFSVTDSRNIAPPGWHVPTNADWTILENYLTANGFNYDGTTTGNKSGKALASAAGWISSTDEGSIGNIDYPAKRNATGFTALPSGYLVEYGYFYDFGSESLWWSATEYDASNALNLILINDWNYVLNVFSKKVCGLSVRCVKDN